MNVLVAGYDQEETRRLSGLLRAAGHKVLGAVGRHGARTFVRVITPDCVLVPEGPAGDEVRTWLDDLRSELMWVALPAAGDPVDALAEFADEQRPIASDAPAGARAQATPWDGVLDDAVATAIEGASSPADAPSGFRAPRTRPLAERVQSPTPEIEAALDLNATAAVQASPPSSPAATERTGSRPAPALGAAYSGAAGRALGAGGAAPLTLDSKLAQTRFGDYHSLLEVDLDASPYVIREQFQRLSRLYSPQGWPEKLTQEELSVLTEVGRGLRDAYLILGDPELRARYERALLTTAGARR